MIRYYYLIGTSLKVIGAPNRASADKLAKELGQQILHEWFDENEDLIFVTDENQLKQLLAQVPDAETSEE